MFNDFERETSGLEQEIRKQVGEVKEFQPQIQKIESLEERMRAGRQKAELLGGRLEVMRSEIDDWEKRETEWQMRVGRRLRIFWSTIAAGVLALVVAIIIQNVRSPDPETLLQKTALENYSSRLEQVEEPELHSAGQKDHYPRSLYPSGVAHRHESCQAASPTDSPASTDRETGSSTADPLRILDEI